MLEPSAFQIRITETPFRAVSGSFSHRCGPIPITSRRSLNRPFCEYIHSQIMLTAVSETMWGM